jgi:hypothetical protein
MIRQESFDSEHAYHIKHAYGLEGEGSSDIMKAASRRGSRMVKINGWEVLNLGDCN